MKKEVKLHLVFVFSVIAILFAVILTTTPSAREINSFEECVAAGNSVMESFPRQCRTTEGRLFAENIGVGDRINCTEESRNADTCIEIYQPVCGWFDPEKVRCVTEPCAATFTNSCFACMDETVLHYIGRECPA